MITNINDKNHHKPNNNVLYGRVSVTLVIFLAMLIIYLKLDFHPNTILIDVDLPEGYLEPVINLNSGDLGSLQLILPGDIIEEPFTNWRSFSIKFDKQAILNKDSFLLTQVATTAKHIQTIWKGCIPSYNQSSGGIMGYLIKTDLDADIFIFELNGSTWPIEKTPGGFFAQKPNHLERAFGELRIIYDISVGEEAPDLRNITISIDQISPISRETSPICIDSITLAKRFNSLGITIPIKSWLSDETLSSCFLADTVTARKIMGGHFFVSTVKTGDLSLQINHNIERTTKSIIQAVTKLKIYLALMILFTTIIIFIGLDPLFRILCHKRCASNFSRQIEYFIENILKNNPIPDINKQSLFRSLAIISLVAVIIPHTQSKIMAGFILVLFIVTFFISFPDKRTTTDCLTADLLIKHSEHSWYRDKKVIFPLALFLIVVVAFFLRLVNLTILDPYTDEYLHIRAAKELLVSGQLIYARAEYVTRLVALFYKLSNASSFNEFLFWGRLPGVIFSSLTIIPLYLLAKKINHSVAWIASFLWSLSPWAIGVAKTIREYAFYPFFTLIILLLLVYFFELINNYKKKYFPVLVLITGTIILFFVYALSIDKLSSLKVNVLVLAGAFFSFGLTNWRNILLWFKTKRGVFYGFLILSFMIGILLLIYVNKSGHINLNIIGFSDIWLKYFFLSHDSPMHWWGEHHFPFFGLLFVLLGAIWAIKKQEKNYLWPFILFFTQILAYSFFFARYARPRYIFYALPFFTILVAVSTVVLIEFINPSLPFANRILTTFIIGVYLLQAFNIHCITYPLRSNLHGYVLPTNEYHDKLSSTVIFLENKISDQDVFVSTIFRQVLRISSEVSDDKIFYYKASSIDRFEFVTDIVRKNSQGYLILDSRRNGYPIGHPFFIGDTFVQLVQNKDGMQIYRWER